MNLLPFILAVILLLTYSATILSQSYNTSRQVHRLYVGRQKAERDFQSSVQKKQWDQIPGEPRERNQNSDKGDSPKPSDPKPKEERSPRDRCQGANPPESRINLFPLIHEEVEKHLPLYELAAKLLSFFYRDAFLLGPGEEYLLLDSILNAAKQAAQGERSLELAQLEMGHSAEQKRYYLLLKGTQHSNLLAKEGYPPLSEYFTIDRPPSAPSVWRAHLYLLAVLFGSKNGEALHTHLHPHQNDANASSLRRQALTPEQIATITGDPMIALKDPTFWQLLDLNFHLKESALVAAEDEETGVIVSVE